MFYSLLLLGSIIFLDLCLSGDNAVVIAMAANRLPKEQRDAAIYAGMTLAVTLRVAMGLIASLLLAYSWVSFLGGLLLLWVAYKLGKDILEKKDDPKSIKKASTFTQAMLVIIAADASMSLDNVLAVAALARNHMVLLVIGIVASIAMLTFAARKVADLMDKYKWLNWVGLALIIYVAFDLISGSYNITMSQIRS